MTQSRILPLLGPVAVLYLIADAAAKGRGLDVFGGVIGLLAVLCALVPLAVRWDPGTVGSRRVGLLGVGVGLALVPAVAPETLSLAVEIGGALGASLAAAVVLDLALTVPDTPTPLRRGRWLRALPALVGVVAASAGLASALPPFEIAGELVVVPAEVSATPGAAGLGAGALALAIRWLRRRMGSGPEALASNTWGVMGLLPAVGVGVGAVVVVATGTLPAESAWVRVGVALALAAAVSGHAALVDTRRRLVAGRITRRVISIAITVSLVSGLVAALASYVPRTPHALGAASAALLLASLLVHRAAEPFVLGALAPFRGRLLDAVERAREGVGRVSSLEEIAAALLVPLEEAAGSPDATPRLYLVDPPREARVDSAGVAHVREARLSDALRDRLAEAPGEIVVRAPLEEAIVRHPERRLLVESLVAMDALCVVPLSVDGELEGALVVARGRRRSAPSLEEIASLGRLGDRVSGIVGLLSSRARAQRRVGELGQSSERSAERVDELEEELERLREQVRQLRSGRAASRLAAPDVAYGEAMRALNERIEQVAPTDAPVLLEAEGGTPVDSVARRIHAASGRAQGAFVVADCAVARPEDSRAALFGVDSEAWRPGWLRAARGGTLLLADVVALSLDAQAALAEALSTRTARAIDGAASYPLDVRVVASSRLPLAPLVAAGALDAELSRWLEAARVVVPPLRERREDLPSLTLLALDRACRVHGREPKGIAQPALERLLAHPFPGNQRELQHVIDRAVVAAAGPLVEVGDLPPLPALAGDRLDGTWAQIEARVVRHALEAAGGDESEAARALGLERSAFEAKLRRVEGEEGSDGAEDAA